MHPQRTPTTIRRDIEAVDPDIRLARCRVIAARNRRDFLEELAVSELVIARGGEDLRNPGNTAAGLMAFVQSDAGRELATVRAVLGVLERSDQFAEAARLLDPLLAELDQALAREADEAAAAADAERAVDAAEEAARVKLAAKIEADPAVVKARQALAGIRRLGEPLEEVDIAAELLADHH